MKIKWYFMIAKETFINNRTWVNINLNQSMTNDDE